MTDIFLNTGNQAEKDNDLGEMGNKEDEPYNCHIYSLKRVFRLQVKERISIEGLQS